jgi:hypothetical protein
MAAALLYYSMIKKLPLTKEYLEDKYLVQGLSSTQIAAEIGCNYMTVLNKMKEYGVPARKDGIRHPGITKEFLEKEYIVNGKGLQVIAKEAGCTFSTLRRRMKRYGLYARPKDTLIDVSLEDHGDWTVLERLEDHGGSTTWLCRCKCDRTFSVPASSLRAGTSTCCKLCAQKKHCREDHPGWKGHEGISGTIWNYIKQSARKRSIEFNISIEFIWDLFLKQNKKCALSGTDIILAETNSKHMHGLTTASLDRIDSAKGYVEGNVQWVHKDINRMKTNFGQDRFLELCMRVTNQLINQECRVYDYSVNGQSCDPGRCRFCDQPTSFSHKSHAISKMFGGRMVCPQECDSCNKFFGNEVEPHLETFMKFFRTVQGKTQMQWGAPASNPIFGRNKIMRGEDGNVKIRQTESAALTNIPMGDLIPLRVYKTLVKYAFSIMPDREYDRYAKIAKWTRSLEGVAQLGFKPLLRFFVNKSPLRNHLLICKSGCIFFYNDAGLQFGIESIPYNLMQGTDWDCSSNDIWHFVQTLKFDIDGEDLQQWVETNLKSSP